MKINFILQWNNEDWDGLWLNCIELGKMNNNPGKLELSWKMNIVWQGLSNDWFVYETY